MKIEVLLVCLLFFELAPDGKGHIFKEVNEMKQNCTFILSNGDYEEFFKAVPLFKNCTQQFKKPSLLVKLVNYSLPAFPNESFSDLPSLDSFKLDIGEGSQIQLLSPLLPNYSVFDRMNSRSAVIDVSDSASIIGWKWEALSEIELTSMGHFEFIVQGTKLIQLSADFGKIAHGGLTVIRILKSHLRWLSKDVFGPHSNMIILELRGNLLEKFERYHLPQNPSKLQYLDLGENRLQYIPIDVFANMKLAALYLDGNNLKISSYQIERISEIVFSRTFINGVIWPCDCSDSFLELFKKWKDYFQKEECYINDNIQKIEDFVKSCNKIIG